MALESWVFLTLKNDSLNCFEQVKRSKIRKFRIIFDIENWLWKSNFGTFWHLPIRLISKIQSFHYDWFLVRNLPNFVSLPWKLHNRYCHNDCQRLQSTCLLKTKEWNLQAKSVSCFVTHIRLPVERDWIFNIQGVS